MGKKQEHTYTTLTKYLSILLCWSLIKYLGAEKLDSLTETKPFFKFPLHYPPQIPFVCAPSKSGLSLSRFIDVLDRIRLNTIYEHDMFDDFYEYECNITTYLITFFTHSHFCYNLAWYMRHCLLPWNYFWG